MIANIKRTAKLKYRVPEEVTPMEWEIICTVDPADKRTSGVLRVSHGYWNPGNSRDVSLTIGNKVVVLDPLNQNALVKLLLDAM